MKKIILILFVAASATIAANAQKFGHINTGELVSLMSETDSAMVQLQAYQNELVEEMDAMQTEYNTKLNTYQQKSSTWTAAIKESKENELSEIVQRLNQFQQTAQQDLANMQQTLMTPIYQKAQEALNKIGKDNNLLYIFDTSAGAIIYMDEAQSMNLLPLAKAALGIPAEKVAPSQLPQ
ncbi:MAG: OmpH family outer membrane protein [Bacteroidales bacterium]|nr:OmpH family outer membrane protein [Bacteroidales bacterium]